MERIPYDLTKEPNTVEVLFIPEFDKIKRQPMDDEMAEFMIKIVCSDIPEDDKELNDMFLCQLIVKRFKALGYTMDVKTKLFLTYLAKSPGMAVLYIHYLAYSCKQNKKTHLDFDFFCKSIFPHGFPSEDDLHKLWDGQKVSRNRDQPGGDNLLDYFSASESIMNIPEPIVK